MYDPKVSVIWEIIRDFFDAQGAPIDPAFYSTYEDQNHGLSTYRNSSRSSVPRPWKFRDPTRSAASSARG